MTRINIPSPAALTDQHLLAEYRELPRVFALARAVPCPPPTYRLGPGHVTFFFARTLWLARRQSALIAECIARGFSLTHTTAPTPIAGLDGDWTPDADALALSLGRLRQRLIERPGFYRHRGKIVGPDFYGAA